MLFIPINNLILSTKTIVADRLAQFYRTKAKNTCAKKSENSFKSWIQFMKGQQFSNTHLKITVIENTMNKEKQDHLTVQGIDHVCQTQKEFPKKSDNHEKETNKEKNQEKDDGRFINGTTPKRYRLFDENGTIMRYPPKCPKPEPKRLMTNEIKAGINTEKAQQRDQIDQLDESLLLYQQEPRIKQKPRNAEDQPSFEGEPQNSQQESGYNMNANDDNKNESRQSQRNEPIMGEERSLNQDISFGNIGFKENTDMNQQESLIQDQNQKIMDQKEHEPKSLNQYKVIDRSQLDASKNKSKRSVGFIVKANRKRNRNEFLQDLSLQRQNHFKYENLHQEQIMENPQREPRVVAEPDQSSMSQNSCQSQLSNNLDFTFNLSSVSISITRRLKQAYDDFDNLIIDKHRYSQLMLKNFLIILQQVKKVLNQAIKQQNDYLVQQAHSMLHELLSDQRLQKTVHIDYSLDQMRLEINKCLGGAKFNQKYLKIQLQNRFQNKLKFLKHFSKLQHSIYQYQILNKIKTISKLQDENLSQNSSMFISQSQNQRKSHIQNHSQSQNQRKSRIQDHSQSQSQRKNLPGKIHSNSPTKRSNNLLPDSILISQNIRSARQLEGLQNQQVNLIERKSPQSFKRSGRADPSPIVAKIQSNSAVQMAQNVMDIFDQVEGQLCDFVLLDEISILKRGVDLVPKQQEKNVLADLQREPHLQNRQHLIENDIKASVDNQDQVGMGQAVLKQQTQEDQIKDYLKKIIDEANEIAQIAENNQLRDQQNFNHLDIGAQILNVVLQATNNAKNPQKIIPSFLNSQKKLLPPESQKQNISLKVQVQKKLNPAQEQQIYMKSQDKGIHVRFPFQSVETQTQNPLFKSQEIQVSLDNKEMKIKNTYSQKIISQPIKNSKKIIITSKNIDLYVLPLEKKVEPIKLKLSSSNQANEYVQTEIACASIERQKIHAGLDSMKIQVKKERPQMQRDRKKLKHQEKLRRQQRNQFDRAQQILAAKDPRDLNCIFWSNLSRPSVLVREWIQMMRSQKIIHLNLAIYRNAMFMQYLTLCLAKYPLTLKERFEQFRKKDKKMLDAFRKQNIQLPLDEVQRIYSFMDAIQEAVNRKNVERALNFGQFDDF